VNIRRWFSEHGIVRKVGAVLACMIGARMVTPGIDQQVIADFFRSGGASPLLRVYDWLVGGAIGRGAVLALGLLPYVTARIYLRLAAVVSPRFADPVRRKTQTRWLTFGFSVVQSYGFARFVENLPGAVAQPGPQFIATTMLVMTASAMTAMWLFEPPRDADDDATESIADTAESVVLEPRSGDVPALAAPAPDLDRIRLREPVILDRQ
jgi:preprotein translocase subunit SecY